jgi:tetratricopeptide (TPR) repeat protein
MTLSTDVMRRPYPSYHKPLETARIWLRDGEHKSDALELLTMLRNKYAHVLAVGNEYVLALLENGRHPDAMTELGRLDRQFQEVDEETRCRWGRLYKQEGDRAWKDGDLVTAESRYLQALEEYQRGYALRQGHYPGINQATLLLYLAALARQHKDAPHSQDYLRRAEAVANDVLALRDKWPRDFPDDNIWHLATVGEANLLKRNWPEAATHYKAALGASNIQPFHRQSIGNQARRVLEALALLDVRPEPPFDKPDELFGPLA